MYYELAKSKLLALKDTLNNTSKIGDLTELREYYVRCRSSAFFREAWFYVTKYHASDVFFESFIDPVSYNTLSHPDSKTKYLTQDMYLNIILDKAVAKRITQNVNEKRVTKKDLLLNDSIFYESLEGVEKGKFTVVYEND
jgi:hypothetical protein